MAYLSSFIVELHKKHIANKYFKKKSKFWRTRIKVSNTSGKNDLKLWFGWINIKYAVTAKCNISTGHKNQYEQ